MNHVLVRGKGDGNAVFPPDVPLRVAQVGHYVKAAPRRHIVAVLEVFFQDGGDLHLRLVEVDFPNVHAGGGGVNGAQHQVEFFAPQNFLRHLRVEMALSQLDPPGEADTPLVLPLEPGQLRQGVPHPQALRRNVAFVVVGEGYPHHPPAGRLGANLLHGGLAVVGMLCVYMAVEQVQLHLYPSHKKAPFEGGGVTD